MSQNRTIKVRMREEAYEEIEAAARQMAISVSAYVRIVALKAARADTKYEAA